MTIYTMTSQQAYLAAEDRLTPDDSHGVLIVPGKLAVIGTRGVITACGTPQWRGPTPAQIAERMRGLEIRPR